MVHLEIKGQVIPLKTHRPLAVNKATGRPFMYKDKRLRDYEKSAREQLKEQYKGPVMNGAVDVEFWYYVKDWRKRDLVNLLETTSDLLQGIVIKDDSQIRSFKNSLIVDKDKNNPRTEISVKELKVW